jgi:hypothetical protein
MANVEILCIIILESISDSGDYIDSFMRNAWRRSSIFLFCIEKERHELFYCRHWNIASVIPCKKGFPLEVEEEDCRRHNDVDNADEEKRDSCLMVWARTEFVLRLKD